jgi:parallel beta-helix repeat protein
MTLRTRYTSVWAMLLAFALTTTSAAAATRVVDDDGEATSKNCDAGTDTPYTTINQAIADAAPGDKIIVCPGVYAEQIVVSMPLTITGVSGATIKPAGTVVNSSSLATGAPISAIVLVQGTTAVTIDGLAVDGSTGGPFTGCGTNYVGIYYRNASGAVKNVAVRNIALGPSLEGCQAGLGIFVQSGDSGTSTVSVTGSSVHGYQKNGITGNEVGTTLTATGNAVTGWGPTPFLAQNGIQIGWGAGGEIKDNRVVDNVWSPCAAADDPDCAAGASSGVIVFGGDNVTVSGNTIATSQIGVYLEGNNGSVLSNQIQNTIAFDGVAVIGNLNQILGNSIFDSDEAGIYLFGDTNTVQKNTINEAPIGVFEDDGTGNTITLTGKGKNLFYNVDVVLEQSAAVTVSSTPVGRTSMKPVR